MKINIKPFQLNFKCYSVSGLLLHENRHNRYEITDLFSFLLCYLLRKTSALRIKGTLDEKMLNVLIKISPQVIVFYRKNPTKIPTQPTNLSQYREVVRA